MGGGGTVTGKGGARHAYPQRGGGGGGMGDSSKLLHRGVGQSPSCFGIYLLPDLHCNFIIERHITMVSILKYSDRYIDQNI